MTFGQVKLTYEGKRPENVGGLRHYLDRLQKAGATAQRLSDSAQAYLGRLAYLDATAGWHADTLRVRSGPRFIMKDLVVVSDSRYEVEVNELFTKGNLSTAIDRVLSDYYAIGYYYARANISDIARSGTSVDVTLHINRGPIVTLDQSRFGGLKFTRADILRRYMPVQSGDTLTTENIRRAQQAAESIPFITLRPPIKVEPRPGYTTADLYYDFVEQRRFTISGGGGYIPDDPVGLVWSLRMSFNNLLGDGRQARVFSERPDKGRQVLQIGYTQPIFLIGVGSLNLGVGTRDYRDQFYEFALNGEYAASFAPGTTTGLTVGWKHVEPAIDALGFSRFSVGFLLKRERLDNRANPTSGYSIDWNISYSYRRYSTDTLSTGVQATGFNETNTSLSLGWYQHIAGPLVGHMAANYWGLETSDSIPPLSELKFLGGPGTIRGYRTDQFVAKRTAFGTIEPHLRFSQGYLFAFYDAAYINLPVLTNGRVGTDEYYRYGIGLGLALVSTDRSIALSLGWGKGAPFDQPRLSIQLLYGI